MSASPRFGRRAAAAAALQAANEALNELPPTPDEMRQQKAEMQRAVQSEAWRRQDAESKADSLATQVQQLFGELQRKDREIAAVTRSKAEIEERWRVSEVERAKAALGPQGAAAAADDTDAVIRSLALAVDAGPKFEEELREFVFAKQDERRLVLVREKMRDLNPFSAPTGKTPKAVVLERVRDCIYRKGRELRQVFRMIDEDKSGELTHEEFRRGLQRCGAVLSDEEFQTLVAVVDYNNNGTIEYIEFAETMKVNDVQMSFLPNDAPYASVFDGRGEPGKARFVGNAKRGRNLNSNIMVQAHSNEQTRTVHTKPKAPAHYGLQLLPKGDILRRLAEKVELKHKDVSRAFHQYDRNRDGVLDRQEFKALLDGFGMDLTNAEYSKLLKRVDTNDDGTIDLMEWFRNFSDGALSGPPGAVGGIHGASWAVQPASHGSGARLDSIGADQRPMRLKEPRGLHRAFSSNRAK